MATNDIGRVTPIWRGFFSAAATYELNDIVIDTAGSVWWHKSEEQTTGVTPAVGDFWDAVIDMSIFSGLIQTAIVTAQTAVQAAQAAETGVAEDVQRAETAAQSAEASAAAASESAAGVGAYAQAAAESATAAAGSATEAAGSADAAAASATASAGSADEAESWATGGSGGTATATNNAKYYSEQSASSATSSASSAAAAQAVKDSIPDDYTTLSNDVGDLKTQINSSGIVEYHDDTYTNRENIGIYLDGNDYKIGAITGYKTAQKVLNPNRSYLITVSNPSIIAYSNATTGVVYDSEVISGSVMITPPYDYAIMFVMYASTTYPNGTFSLKFIEYPISADIEEVGDNLENYQAAISEYFEPVNMFNKNSALNRDGYKVNASGGYEALNGSTVSHPIKIEVGKTYVFKFSASYYGATLNKIVRFCDAEGNLILNPLGDPFINATPFADNSGGVFTITSEMSAYEYCCVNVRTSDKGVMIFAEGDSLPAYSDYFDPYWKILESALPSEIPLPVNVLYGKKAAFTGDSICYGAGSTGGYASIIGTNNNMTVSNIGVSGGTICSGTGRFCISESVDSMPENYDYYIVEGGVNDASQEHGETLGTISTGYNATLNTATMCGAMESLCKKLQLNFKGKKYGFIFPHNVYDDTSVWNTSWRATMKQCLEKWGIPYLDLSEKCAQLRNLDALRIYTSNGDGWHPTVDGYKLYYVDKITAWMKTL